MENTDKEELRLQQLIHLRSLGKSRDEMCLALGVSMSALKRLIHRLLRGNALPPKKNNGRNIRLVQPRTPPVDDGKSILDKAREILGSRMRENKDMGYMLDGNPAGINRIIKAAGLKFPI